MNPFLNPMLRWLLAPEGDGGGQGAGGSGLPPQSLQPPAGGQPGQQPPSSQPGGQQPNQGTPPQTPPAGDSPVTMGQLNELLQQHGRQIQDATFAALRRSGVVGGAGAGEGNGRRQPAPAAGQQPTGEDAMMERFERRGALDRALTAQNRQLPDSGRARMVRALDQEQPEDVGAWVTQWFTDLGHPPAAPAGGTTPGSSPGATTPPASGQQRPPVTNVPAAAGSAPSSIRNPYELTQDDVNTMVRANGWHKTGTQIMDSLRQAPPLRLQVRRR